MRASFHPTIHRIHCPPLNDRGYSRYVAQASPPQLPSSPPYKYNGLPKTLHCTPALSIQFHLRQSQPATSHITFLFHLTPHLFFHSPNHNPNPHAHLAVYPHASDVIDVAVHVRHTSFFLDCTCESPLSPNKSGHQSVQSKNVTHTIKRTVSLTPRAFI